MIQSLRPLVSLCDLFQRGHALACAHALDGHGTAACGKGQGLGRRSSAGKRVRKPAHERVACAESARNRDAQGRLLATHGPYPEALRKTARRLAVPLADLEAATMALFQELGPEGTKDIFCHVPAGHPNYPEGLSDNSHLQERGAVRVAELFLQWLKQG